MAYTSQVGKPPLDFVLSEVGAQLLLFSFVDEIGRDIMESVLLPVWTPPNPEGEQTLNQCHSRLLMIATDGRGCFISPA